MARHDSRFHEFTAPASSSGASFFAWQRRARNKWLVMNRKGPWEGYRRQVKPIVSFSPSFARAISSKERRLGTRQGEIHSNLMDRIGPIRKVSKKQVHLLRWTTFPGRAGWNFGWMDRALTPSWFFPNLSTFLGCSCCTDQYSWYVAAKALVLSLRSVWCHSNHVKAHASDATIIARFASTRSSGTQVLLAGNLFTQENGSKACSKLSTRRVVGKIRMLAKPRNPCKLSLFRFHSSA